MQEERKGLLPDLTAIERLLEKTVQVGCQRQSEVGWRGKAKKEEGGRPWTTRENETMPSRTIETSPCPAFPSVAPHMSRHEPLTSVDGLPNGQPRCCDRLELLAVPLPLGRGYSRLTSSPGAEADLRTRGGHLAPVPSWRSTEPAGARAGRSPIRSQRRPGVDSCCASRR